MRRIVRATVLLLAAVVLALVGPAAVAQAATSDGQVSAQDKAFLRAAHQSNLAEIATGKLAEQKVAYASRDCSAVARGHDDATLQQL